MPLLVPDTLSGRTTPVRPGSGRGVALYVCGPTVYDAAHVGHARTYLYFDVVRRFLEAEGTTVRHVMNVTDIEDKIDARAAALGTTPRALARREERSFFDDLRALDVLFPQQRPRATAYVPEMIRVARALERTGRVVRSDGEWRYEPPARSGVDNFATAEELARHAVAEPGHPFPTPDGGDRSVLLWKRQGPPKPSWSSPWGRGVPGWHLECFAMASRLLGVPVDLHGGARDLVYPHHFAENEIAFSLEGAPFSRSFLHTGLVLQGGRKMAKSTGNLVPLRTALAAAGAAALRWYLFGAPPRDRFEWSADGLARATHEYDALRGSLADWLEPGRGGRRGAAPAAALARRTRLELAHGLRTDLVLERIRAFAARLRADPSGRIARGERPAALRALRSIEARTGLTLTTAGTASRPG